jgi:hypothetical protein
VDRIAVTPPELRRLIGISTWLREVSLGNVGFGYGRLPEARCGAPLALALPHGAFSFAACRCVF